MGKILRRTFAGVAAPIPLGLARNDSRSVFSDSWQTPVRKRLTLRQSLSHTAGPPEYEGNRDLLGAFMPPWGCRRCSSVWQSLEISDGTPVRYEPGTELHFSSFDGNLVGAALFLHRMEEPGLVPRTRGANP